jgi:predicted TIM-barrel fold metal-dependent hydrolase
MIIKKLTHFCKGDRAIFDLARHGRLTTLLTFVAICLMACKANGQVSARFPAIDIHTHLGGVTTWPGANPNFTDLINSMKARNVIMVVDFKAPDNPLANAIYGDRVSQRVASYPDQSRFKLFCNVPIDDANNVFLAETMPNYSQWAADQLEDAIKRGAIGLKIKDQAGDGGGYVGWTYDKKGVLVPFDSPVFDRLWEKAAERRAPVLQHIAVAYKSEHQPGRTAGGVHWEILMYERERVLRKHPHMILIGAHWGCSFQDLSYLWEVLEKYPNFYTEGMAHIDGDAFGTVDSYEQQFLTVFQDRIMYGTDYMEATFDWLTSYLQRLDMTLPWVEKWPISNEVFEKFYNKNAKKLLHLNTENAIPVAHAGFTQTRVLGELTTLDGSGSYDFEGSPLTYQWKQASGPVVTLSSSTSANPTFTPTQEGTYIFELVANDGQIASAPRQIMVNVVGPEKVFQESDGLVVMEAENFWRKTDRQGRNWSFANSQSGFSGQGYLECGPDNGASVEINKFKTEGAELEYKVWIATPGTYIVFIRGNAPNVSGNTVHVGLDGEEVRLADRIGEFPVGAWSWVNETREKNNETGNLDRNLAVLNIVEPGTHIINVWMAEDGFKLDKMLLARHVYAQTSFAVYDPGTGFGPPESPRTGGTVPVELSSFSAKAQGNSVELIWTTASETNNFGFDVERSRNGNEFTKIGFVRGSGATTISKQYKYFDRGLDPGRYDYRLKQIDADGSFTYSGTVQASVQPPADYLLDQNYPNPFNPQTRIKYAVKKTDRVTLKIYNEQGQLVRTLVDEKKPAGEYEVLWDGRDNEGAQLSAGTYFYQLKVGDFASAKRAVLLK